MEGFKLPEMGTDISSLDIEEKPWDLVLDGKEYKVIRIKGYIHTKGAGYESDLYAYPRVEEPNYNNLVKYNLKEPVCWGIRTDNSNYVDSSVGDPYVCNRNKVIITRNGKDFCECDSVIEALNRIDEIKTHPLKLNNYKFGENCIGHKIWYREQKAIISKYIDGEACIEIVPDGKDKFKIPDSLKALSDYCDEVPSFKISIFNSCISWDRDIVWSRMEE